jgi:microcystin degradation protein MlrC
VSVRAAIATGQAAGKYPIFLADHADNTGGGAPGDSTEILSTFRELKLRDAILLYLVDPEVAMAAHKAGVGNRLKTQLGGKSSPIQGPPLEVDAEIVAVTDGAFAYDGPMWAGLTGNMGPSAWLRFDDGISVVVVTAREQPFDPAFARTLGIDCTKMKYVAVKSAAHFRSGFEKLAGNIYNVDARAILTHDWGKLPYKKRTRKVYPLEVK